MNKLLDKLILFTLCIVFYVQSAQGPYMVVPIICVVSAAALTSYFENRVFRVIFFAGYCVVCIAFPSLLFFLPVFCYDAFWTRLKFLFLIAILPLAADFAALPALSWAFILVFIALALFLSRRTDLLIRARASYIELRDSAKEFSILLEDKNRELMEKQDYEVNLATLNERNRIARDIHDTVGHVLSNSILQTGALIATCRDDAARERLTVLKDTLTSGMDSIRESIHNLYDESLDLKAEVQALADGFAFCDIALNYDVYSNPDKKIKYALIAVLKEALANIIKHSDATEVRVTLREHPALYQLSVKDNGSLRETESGEGIGLLNITRRVEALGGIVNIGRETGFTVFISIPKEK